MKFTPDEHPLKLKEIWAIRIRLQLSGDVRNLALFNLAINSIHRLTLLTEARASIAFATRISAVAEPVGLNFCYDAVWDERFHLGSNRKFNRPIVNFSWGKSEIQ